MDYKNIIIIASIGLFLACGSTERVITDDGKIYEVKGDTFMNNGVDVTQSLTNEEKENIKKSLEEKIEAREASEKIQNELEDKQRELEKVQEEARRKENELKEKQEKLESKRDDLKDAKDDYAKSKKRLTSKMDKFQNLKEKGRLSPKDEEKWLEKIKDLKMEVNEAKTKLEALN